MLDWSTHYRDGVEHGKTVSWHENGNLAFETEKQNGVLDGLVKSYDAKVELAGERSVDRWETKNRMLQATDIIQPTFC